jgi:hypothetical protein
MRANPRQWGALCAVGWFFAGWAVSARLWVGLVAAAVGYLITSWSVSRGPGRSFFNWRMRDRP